MILIIVVIAIIIITIIVDIDVLYAKLTRHCQIVREDIGDCR